MNPRFNLRLIFELFNFNHLPVPSFHPFVASTTIWKRIVSSLSLSSFSCYRSLIHLNSSVSLAENSRILLLGHFWQPFPLRCSARSSFVMDICQWTLLKKLYFKELRSLELSDIIFVGSHISWEVLGALPSLENLTLKDVYSSSHPVHAAENSNSQSGGRKYFEALESLSVSGSFSFIQHLLGLIDSPWLKSINIYPNINRNEHIHEHLFAPSTAIVASRWSQSLKTLVIDTRSADGNALASSKSLMLLTDLHEIQRFDLHRCRMENMDDDVRRLVMPWPKLTHLSLLPLNQSYIFLSTLRIIAESCPELFFLRIPLDASTFPPFDTSSKRLCHSLELLNLGGVSPPNASLECQIQAALHLDSIFPSVFVEAHCQDATWSGIRDLLGLCQEARRVY